MHGTGIRIMYSCVTNTIVILKIGSLET